MALEPDLPIFSAADLLDHKRRLGTLAPARPPHTVILVLQSQLLQRARQAYPTEAVRGFAGELLLLRPTGRVGVMGGFGIGAPVVAALADELAAWGVRRWMLIGLAGGLQAGMRVGDIVLSRRAYRGEGTSRHYLPAGEWAEAMPALSDGWGAALMARGRAFQAGATWTTDAPFREVRRTVLQHERNGVLTVEMEAAALLAVAQHYAREAACGFAIADTLANGKWRLEPDQRPAERGLRTLLDTAIEYALRLP